MAELWDPQPFPLRGDADEVLTFEGVGRVMTTWEHVEFGLARLLSIFARAPDAPEGLAGYQGTIFRERLNSLRRATHIYFVAHCDQELEGEFDRLCDVFERFADRRNEVAHGAVFDMAQFDDFGSQRPPSYMLIPPYHSLKK